MFYEDLPWSLRENNLGPCVEIIVIQVLPVNVWSTCREERDVVAQRLALVLAGAGKFVFRQLKSPSGLIVTCCLNVFVKRRDESDILSMGVQAECRLAAGVMV